MKKNLCKRAVVFLFIFVLCMQSVLPVFAQENTALFETAGIVRNSENAGMAQPIDISETGISACEMTAEEFLAEYGADATEESVSVNSAEVDAQGAAYMTVEDAGEYLRSQMVARKKNITLNVNSGVDSAVKDLGKIFAKAFEYDVNGKPNEGDYLYWHIKGYRWSADSSGNSKKIKIYMVYRTTASEEKYVDQRVNQIISDLNLKSESLNEYEKVRAIYDYVMSIITYDTYHYQTNQNYPNMYTTYTALKDGYAVCQAYATLFYRLCEEVGISARVISGNDDERGVATHGWNIVKIRDYYYNVDATWDDSDYPTHSFFLKNMGDFVGHQRNRSNDGAAFDKKFPTAPESYLLPEENEAEVNMDAMNVSGALQMENGVMESMAANGKNKIVFFINLGEDGSTQGLSAFYGLNCVMSGMYDVFIVDIYDGYAFYTQPDKVKKQMLEIFKERTATPGYYKYSQDYQNGRNYLAQYAAMADKATGRAATVVLVDTNNHVKFYGTGIYGIMALDRAANRTLAGNITNLNAVQVKNNEMSLSWDAVAGATSYRVYRKISGGTYFCIGTTASNTYADKVLPNRNYSYKAVALQNGVAFAESAEINTATQQMLLKKGKTYTVDGYKYKVLQSTSKTKTVAFCGVTNKKLTKIMIPDTVEIDGMKYKVTEIGAKALSGNKKVKAVSVGANVTKIGNKAFLKAKNLKLITVDSKKLKKVGSKALSGISAKAQIIVPASKLSKYKKILKGKGQKSSVKIKK